jgi:hypothetical protein
MLALVDMKMFLLFSILALSLDGSPNEPGECAFLFIRDADYSLIELFGQQQSHVSDKDFLPHALILL